MRPAEYKNLQQTNHKRGRKQEEAKKRKENIGLHPKIKKFSAGYKAKVAKETLTEPRYYFLQKSITYC